MWATGKPLILVLINGRPLTINWADQHIPAIVEAWYPGSQGGKAITEVLFGDYNPGGKLTVTFPKSVGQIPFNFPAKPASQVNGGTKPGLHGNQSRVNGALYPFGYGLSYTRFKYDDLKISPEVVTPFQTVDVSFTVTNTGKYAGDEIPQLYVRDVVSSVIVYEKYLCGFDRIHLNPGESKQVKFTIQPEDIALLNEYHEWVVEPGEFRVMVGASSEDIRLKGVFNVAALGAQLTQKGAQDASGWLTDNKSSESVLKVVDKDLNTKWQGVAGDYITFSLQENAEPGKVEIIWANSGNEPVAFDIQLSSGGGQFLTVYQGTYQGAGIKQMTYTFNPNSASDLRILIRKGKPGIAEVKIPEFRK